MQNLKKESLKARLRKQSKRFWMILQLI